MHAVLDVQINSPNRHYNIQDDDTSLSIKGTVLGDDFNYYHLTYSLGLTDLVSVDSDVEAFIKAVGGGDLPSMKNNGIYVTVGYSFGG